MKFFDIQNINDNFNEFALAKIDVENKWVESKVIKEDETNIPLTKFINKLNIMKYIVFVDEEHPFPFNKVEDYIFYCSSGDTDIDKESINYIMRTLSKLNVKDNSQKIKAVDLALEEKGMPNPPFYLYNKEYYVVEE
jgi:hypothetical protein